MGAKKVDLKRLAAALPDYPFAYLITVDDGHRVHTVAVEPVLRELPDGPDGPRAVVDVGLIGGRTGKTWPTAAKSPCCGRHPILAATR